MKFGFISKSTHVNMPLEEKDNVLLQIEELIEAKSRMLLDKQNKLICISKQNCFLDTVKQDYINYYNYIIKLKNDEMKALELLNGYINDLTISEQLSQYNLEDAKIEQDKIFREIKIIKKALDNLMMNVNNINIDLKKVKRVG